jgi:hypothetical protein
VSQSRHSLLQGKFGRNLGGGATDRALHASPGRPEDAAGNREARVRRMKASLEIGGRDAIGPDRTGRHQGRHQVRLQGRPSSKRPQRLLLLLLLGSERGNAGRWANRRAPNQVAIQKGPARFYFEGYVTWIQV